jgi:hypothetical protein
LGSIPIRSRFGWSPLLGLVGAAIGATLAVGWVGAIAFVVVAGLVWLLDPIVWAQSQPSPTGSGRGLRTAVIPIARTEAPARARP